MTTLMDSFHLSEHFRLKQHYGRYLRSAGLLAISIHLLLALFSPPYVPAPYHLREQTLQLINIPDEIAIPPVSKAVERPRLPMDAEITPDAPLDMTIPPTDIIFSRPVVKTQPVDPVFIVVDEMPRVVHQVQPVYPELARLAESEGSVLVLATVGETGRVTAAKVLESNASELLEKAAVDAALEWLFRPAMQGDQPVKTQVTIPFAFTID
jgi:TonB family protein